MRSLTDSSLPILLAFTTTVTDEFTSGLPKTTKSTMYALVLTCFHSRARRPFDRTNPPEANPISKALLLPGCSRRCRSIWRLLVEVAESATVDQAVRSVPFDASTLDRPLCSLHLSSRHLQRPPQFRSRRRVSVSLRCLTELAHPLRLVIIFRPSYIGSSK